MRCRLLGVLPLVAALGCVSSFSADVAFLRRHTEVVLLSDKTGTAQVAICPEFQGRVMTSTAAGPGSLSFGWINRDLIEAHAVQPHINVYGGEDRFWLGPEGGPFSIFFAQGATQDLAHWFTPADIDTRPFILAERSDTRTLLRKSIKLVNASGTAFELEVHREIRLLVEGEAWRAAAVAPIEKVNVVGFETLNRISNTGKADWRKETGLLSIWILGMFKPSPQTTVVVPYRSGPVAELGPVVNDAYFGKVPEDRLRAQESVLFFKGDGQHRSKIGVSPRRARGILGSWDAENEALTIVQFTQPEKAIDYVNSMWELPQKDPYGGDAANSYNDGPPEPGKAPLGPFYELESSSPAAALKHNQSLRHTHRTLHFLGPVEELDKIARYTLGVGLAQIQAAFEK